MDDSFLKRMTRCKASRKKKRRIKKSGKSSRLGRKDFTVPDADFELIFLDALHIAAEIAGEHLADNSFEHGWQNPSPSLAI